MRCVVCPHSWENMKKGGRAYTTQGTESDKEEEESYFTSNYKWELQKVKNDIEVEDVILYTGNNK